MQWFIKQNSADIARTAETQDGKVITGAFIAFENGKPLLQDRTISYSPADRQIAMAPGLKPPQPGEAVMAGVAVDLATEFLLGRSLRAVLALQKIGEDPNKLGSNATSDAAAVKAAVQFAMDYSVPPAKDELGPPIDVAIFWKDATIEWKDRKKNCYDQDLKPRSTSGRSKPKSK